MIRRAISALTRAVRGWVRRHREGLHSLLLVLLVAALIGQCGLLWGRVLTLDSMPAGARTLLASLTQREQTTDNSAAALPIRFAARSGDGLYGIQYNADGLADAYESTADIWAQAWSHAGELTPATAAQYRSALRQTMLLMEYDGTIPVHILTGWLGLTPPDGTAQRAAGAVALCRDADGAYTLYLRDSRTGGIFCAPTAADDSLFGAAVGQFEPNDCTLAADTDDRSVSPDLLYFPGGETFDVLSFDAYRGGDGWDDVLTAFGMDADAAETTAYTADGVRVYVSGSSTVRLAEDGSMRYDGTSLRLPASRGNDRLMQCIQMGYDLSRAALDAVGIGASAALTDAYTDENGRYIAVFGLQIGGVPADNKVTGYFARYEFEGGAMVHANLALRTCQTTGETVAIMPEKQAAASLDASVDAVLSLRYIDEAAGTDSSWEQLYDETSDGTSLSAASDDLWGAEDSTEQDTAWNDTPDSMDSTGSTADSETLDTAWYDSTGTPVTPQWYALQYGGELHLPDSGRTLSPEEIVAVRPDFDRLIQGGDAA